MITQMRKLTFLVTNKEYENFIEDIRKLGVVHVDLLQAGATSAEFENASLGCQIRQCF
jgi:V/A-type H+-transporting ATPase subunit I